MRNIITLITILTLNIYINAQHVNQLQKAINMLKNTPCLKNASIGIIIYDLDSNEVLAELNPDLALKPASTQKLLTSAAAIEIFGENYKFQTFLAYSGKIDTSKHTLNGNIIIKGGGDPTLGSKYFDQTKKHQFLNHWTQKIKALKIDTIKGAIIGDASIFTTDIIPETWAWEDLGNYYGAPACGLTVFDNLYTIHLKTNKYTGHKATIKYIEPNIPNLKIKNNVYSANIHNDQSYIFGVPYTYNRYIKGYVPRNKEDFKVKGSMPDPPLLTAKALNDSLLNKNFFISDTPTTARLLDTNFNYKNIVFFDTIFSPSLDEIIKQLNHKSINLFAEHLVIHIGLKLDSVNNTQDAAQSLQNFWIKKGMSPSSISLYDGCGLSSSNLLSASDLLFVLKYMYNKKSDFQAFYNSLPVSGQSGTLKYVCRKTSAEGKIHAKSGSVRHVRSYAGYTKTTSGRNIAFAFILNNFSCSSHSARKKLEWLMIQMVNFDR